MQKYGEYHTGMQPDDRDGDYYLVTEVDARIDALRAALLSCVAVLGMQRDFHKVASEAIAEANRALMGRSSHE
jgi:hypothetical protein